MACFESRSPSVAMDAHGDFVVLSTLFHQEAQEDQEKDETSDRPLTDQGPALRAAKTSAGRSGIPTLAFHALA
jgi:hypothetical protein